MSSESREQENLPIISGRRSAILNLMRLKFFIVYPHLKLQILFYSNGLAILSGFLDITKIVADNFGHHDLFFLVLPKFEIICELLVKWIYGITFEAIKKMLSELH